MAQLTVRDLEPEIVMRLKAHARARGRSLEAEVRDALRRHAEKHTREESAAIAAGIRERMKGMPPANATEVLREDRELGHRDDSDQW